MAWYIPLLIFGARILDVSIGTVRIMLVVAGGRYLAAFLGFVEVLIWALAVGGLISYLTNPWALISYAGGFAAGTLVGMWIEGHLALGYRAVRVISPRSEVSLVAALRQREYRVTALEGAGRDGPVEIAFCVVRRAELPRLLQSIHELDEGAFVTVERTDHAAGGYFQPMRTVRRQWAVRK